ncbi:methyl-accepting chemotaxis protein [Paenibacillus sp. GD4]|uniref:methyl-accepting chemotaxis protein n=1 Tax=Paenibacillus sp. GD4 TaxID=3068890 RepID=UPI002796E049|nr:methyl-accepting chemotaxis protein [Paenibacillus sp. GD4]MDQ1909986.1 methyl-accepting chemotaxis protein [Paenibacillus sp. GD4]
MAKSRGQFSLSLLTMRGKLLIGFAFILLIVSGMSAYQWMQADLMKEQILFQNAQVDKQFLASALKQSANTLDALKSSMMVSKKEDIAEPYNKERAHFYELVEKIAGTAGTSDERKWSAKLTNTSKEFTATFDAALAVVKNKSLPPQEMSKQLESLHEQSQVHKEYIFELTDQFNEVYSQDAAAAVASSKVLLSRSAAVSLFALITVVVVTVAVALIVIRSFTRPLRRLQAAVQLIAEGDLRHKIHSRAKDELGMLSQSFDHMVDQVNRMLRHTKDIAGSLSEHSRSFHELSGSTAAANQDVVRAIQEISVGSEQQAVQSEQSTLIIADLEKEILNIADSATAMQRKSREVSFNTHTGSASMDALKAAVAESEEMLKKVYMAMESLTSSSNQIAKIVSTITEISTQTNVLSLNAAIEAARAGEHGRGFSVIAEEVRLLSTQTNESSQTVSRIISSLVSQTQELHQQIGSTRQSFDQQRDKMDDSVEAFAEIRVSMDELSEQVQQIHGRIERVMQKNSQLIDSVQFVSAIAQQSAAGIEEVNAVSLQQDMAIRRVAEQADDILVLSQELFEEISRFQIDEGVDAGGDAGVDAEQGSTASEVELGDQPVMASAQAPSEAVFVAPEAKENEKEKDEEKKLVMV